MAKKTLSITTKDGICPASLFTPDNSVGDKPLPGILLLMDIWGPRPALDDMAQSIADGGYTVLLPDMFYRHGSYGPLVSREASQDPEIYAASRERMQATTTDMTVSDAEAYLECFAEHGVAFPIGITAYCMGARHAMEVAMANPTRVAAIASLHGTHLAPTDEIANARAEGLKNCRLYIGNAGEDAMCPPEQTARLEFAFRTAGVSYMMETYPDAHHGWSMTDGGAYNADASALQLKRQFLLYEEALG